MKVVTVYESDDGSRWDTEDEARKRDDLVRVVAEAMVPLGERCTEINYLNGYGFVRHDPAAVRGAKRDLLAILARELAWFFTRTSFPTDPDRVDPRTSIIGRVLNDQPGPNRLHDAWYRLMCIDSNGREWGEPCYAERPDRARECREIDGGAK